jgi:Putative bacterial sensory transduction regulator
VDGRRRRGIRLTLILDPAVALVAWVHFAPQLSDGFRKSYRQFLRWNDELPFVKFALSSDERPVLTSEVPAAGVTIDSLGLTIARLVSVCDLLVEDSAHWLWPGLKTPPEPVTGRSRHEALLERYADQLAELTAPVAAEDDSG